MTKIYLGIDVNFVREIKKVYYKRKEILIFLGDFVKPAKVNI